MVPVLSSTVKTTPTRSGRSFFWLLSGIPLFLGSLYALFFFFDYLKDIHFVGEHLLALAFWIVNTALLSLLAIRCARAWKNPAALRLALLVPALSYFFLWFLYLCALIGNFKVGSVITYDAAWVFVKDGHDLSDTVGLPWFASLGVLLVPLAGFGLFFQWKAPQFLQGAQRLEEWIARQRVRHPRYLLLACAVWVLAAVSMFSSNPKLKFFGHFRYDPIVGFFKTADFQFSMNKERLLAAQKDQMAEELIHPRTPRTRNIILFVVDALRADHLTYYGNPRPVNPYLLTLDRPGRFQKIDWVLSNGSESATGQMSIMSSKETRDISHLDYTLSDNLSDNGYKTIHFYSGDSVWCNFNKSFGRKIDVFIDGKTHPGPNGVSDDRMLLDLTESLPPDDGGRHFLCYHLMSVHEAGYLQAAFQRYKPVLNFAGFLMRQGSPNFAQNRQAAINMYDDRVLQMDDILEKIMAILKAKGYLNDYVGAVTADHGQRLGEGGQFGHGRFVSEPILRVPLLFFSSKPLPPFAQTHFGTLWDVAPTLVDLAGLDIPTSWMGQSFLRPRTQPWTYHFSPSSREGNEGAVVYYDHGKILKYSRLLVEKGSKPVSEEVYDLNRDPTEKDNLVGSLDPALLQAMRSKANQHFTTY